MPNDALYKTLYRSISNPALLLFNTYSQGGNILFPYGERRVPLLGIKHSQLGNFETLYKNDTLSSFV